MASAPRATLTKLAFGLVTCDVALYKTAGEAEKPPKWDLAGPNGGKLLDPEPVAPGEHIVETRSDPLADEPNEAFAQAVGAAAKEPYVIEDGSGEMVTASEVRKGIRRPDGSFADLTDGLAEIEDRTKLEEMRVADFIRTEEVRRGRVLGSYYMAPKGPGAAKVIRLLHEAMRNTRRVAVVKFTKRTKQSLAVLIPLAESKAIEVIEIAWAEDIREVPVQCHAAAEVPVTAEEIAVAEQLVEAMSSTRAEALDTLTDDARQMRRELVAKAEAGETFTVPARPEVEEGGEVIELMARGLRDRDALRAAAA